MGTTKSMPPPIEVPFWTVSWPLDLGSLLVGALSGSMDGIRLLKILP